jgi:hypothetical protein
MAAAATYRIGRSDFFLPADIKADADALNAQVHELDNALQSNTAAPVAWFDTWNAWYAGWWAFYRSTFDGGYISNLLAAINDSNRDELVAHEEQFEIWRQQAAEYGTPLSEGSHTAPSSGSGDSLKNHLADLGLPSVQTIGILVGIIVGLYVLWRAAK